MKEMQLIQPEMKKIQEKYKKDPEKLNQKTMELWKTHKVNPLSGCLPLLIQMPIIYALYKTIDHFKTEFTTAKFLWIGCMPAEHVPKIPYIPFLGNNIPLFGNSLATPDLILVVIYGLSMYLSQMVTVSAAPQKGNQKLMAIMMSVMITFVMYNFQSALILYWLIFNLLSILQQQILFKLSADKEETKINLEEPEEIPEEIPLKSDFLDEESKKTAKLESSGKKKKRKK